MVGLKILLIKDLQNNMKWKMEMKTLQEKKNGYVYMSILHKYKEN